MDGGVIGPVEAFGTMRVVDVVPRAPRPVLRARSRPFLIYSAARGTQQREQYESDLGGISLTNRRALAVLVSSSVAVASMTRSSASSSSSSSSAPRRCGHRQKRTPMRAFSGLGTSPDPQMFCPAPDPPEVAPPDDPIGYDFGYDSDPFFFGGQDLFHDAGQAENMYRRGYHELMADSVWLGDWEAACEVLRDMRSLGVPPDATSYYVAITACQRAGAWERAAELIEEMWDKDIDPDVPCYDAAIGACEQADKHDRDDAEKRAKELSLERHQWGSAPTSIRFHGTPAMKWQREVRRYGCGVQSVMNWRAGPTIPAAPSHECWLLPNQDDVSHEVARHQAVLRQAGWKVLSCNPDLIETLYNKDLFRRHVVRLGMADLLPKHFDSPEQATYPCILKPAIGTFGKDTHVVRSADQVMSFTRTSALAPRWLLQELIPGRIEWSTTLLVFQGEIYDVIGTRYEYDAEEYVWPHVKEVQHEYHSVPEDHVDVFRKILAGFSGICCLGYKLRPDGSLALFEVNPRIGGDLVFDVPKMRARVLFEKLDALFS